MSQPQDGKRPQKRARVDGSTDATSSSGRTRTLSSTSAAGPKFVACDKQGAEGRIFVSTFLSRKSVCKERFAKTYRHPELDRKLRYSRMVHEARCLVRCAREGIDVPQVYFVDEHHMSLHLEFIEGWTVKDYLLQHSAESEWNEVADAIGATLAKMHDVGIVHGDLTTSNMMIRRHQRKSDSNDHSPAKPLKVTLIDFGLSAQSVTNPEDKAVDLYVLERAMASTHPGSDVRLVPRIMEAYRKACRSGHYQTMEKLSQVRLRGRKRLAFG